MKHYKIVFDKEIQRHYVIGKEHPNGAWLQLSKPYKRKRNACIKLNMLYFNIPYKLALRMYYADTEICLK